MRRKVARPIYLLIVVCIITIVHKKDIMSIGIGNYVRKPGCLWGLCKAERRGGAIENKAAIFQLEQLMSGTIWREVIRRDGL
jgi:hypothetical protein